MPTYRNIHPNQYLNIPHEIKSFNLAPGASLETTLVLDHIDYLLRTSNEPFL